MKMPFTLQINNKSTYFVQKIWKGLLENGIASKIDYLHYKSLYLNSILGDWDSKNILMPKLHTIRSGERWAVGMPIEFTIDTLTDGFFNFAPEINCTTVQKIEISYITKFHISIDGNLLDDISIEDLAVNDGFEGTNSFKNYFNKDFIGQIVHWTDFQYEI